jgi:hypothetical protein
LKPSGLRKLTPFSDGSISINLQATKAGVYKFAPRIVYVDNLGKRKQYSPKPINLTVNSALKPQTISETPKTPATSGSKVFDVFLCYKKSSAKDFADHLKAGLEELGYHTFQDSKDIPMITGNEEKWDQIRDNALLESRVFILLMTPGFELSTEVVKELNMARKAGDKKFIFFRIRSMGRRFSIKLDNEVFETGKQEQVSFETKEELLRLAHSILAK